MKLRKYGDDKGMTEGAGGVGLRVGWRLLLFQEFCQSHNLLVSFVLDLR